MTYFRVESKPTFRDLAGRFDKANAELLDIRRDEMRALGRQFVNLAGEEAPGGKGHTVARGIRFRSFVTGNSVGFSVTPGKIGEWHLKGTGIYGPRHRLIVPVRAAALRFVVNGETLFRKWVRGIKPNPFFERAYKRWQPLAKAGLNRISTRWSEVLSNR